MANIYDEFTIFLNKTSAYIVLVDVQLPALKGKL